MTPSPRARATPALAALSAGLVLLMVGCDAGSSQDAAPTASAPPAGELAEVVRAIDGDTIDVRIAGERRRVRLLGIDSPESTTLRTGRAECGGAEASAAMRALVGGSPRVVLATDATQDAQDQYGRLLAYVSPQGGARTLQEEMLAAGWAKVYEQRGQPIERDGAFRAAAADAKRSGAGVWNLCGGNFRLPR